MASLIHDGSSNADAAGAAVELLRPSTAMEPGVHASGSWAARVDGTPHAKLGFVAMGRCWLLLDGRDPVPLGPGDFYLLSNPAAHRLASDPAATTSDAVSPWWCEADADLGEEAAPDLTHVCQLRIDFDPDGGFLADALPRFVHVRAGEPRGALLSHVSHLLVSERASLGVGSELVTGHLSQLLLVYMLRAHVEHTDLPAGWLAALGDDGISAALRLMHGDIARRWTLDELAAHIDVSRSTFATAFRRRVGVPPLTYMIEWRMSVARTALVRGTHSISELADLTGYESESAFSAAFSRVVGLSPRHYRDRARSQRQ